jgi:NAD-dependent dihydropyrimidine dehydrogenase PreA subunit
MLKTIKRIPHLLHAYVYGRWNKQYIHVLSNVIIPRLGPRGKQWWADRFHAKVISPEHAKALVTVDEDIRLRDLEQVIPYPIARDLVLKGSPDVVVYDCACRRTRENPCQPIQVCMIVGKSFVDFVLKYHPESSRRLSQAEAVELLETEHKRGRVQTAWFKDAMGGRFYAICNCCKCCCFGIDAMLKHGAPMVASSGYVAQVDETSCTACGTCQDACHFEAVKVNGTAAVQWDACMGCGVCESQCPSGAMTLVRDERKGVPLDVRALAQEQVIS